MKMLIIGISLLLFAACTTSNEQPKKDYLVVPVEIGQVQEPKLKKHDGGMIKVTVTKNNVKKTNDAYNKAFEKAEKNCAPISTAQINDMWVSATPAAKKKIVKEKKSFQLEYVCF